MILFLATVLGAWLVLSVFGGLFMARFMALSNESPERDGLSRPQLSAPEARTDLGTRQLPA